jgi:hypothetical protein
MTTQVQDVDPMRRRLTVSRSLSDVNGRLDFVTPKSGKSRTVRVRSRTS